MPKIFPPSKRTLLVTSVLVICIAGGAFAYAHTRKSETPAPQPPASINYNPPTEEEKQAANGQKEKNVQRQEAESTPSAKNNAQIVLVDAGQYNDSVEVRAYVSNVYEDGGSCSVTFSQGSQTVKHSSKAFKDATTTQCEPFRINRTEFPSAGDWQLVVSYQSSSHSGQTDTKKVTIK